MCSQENIHYVTGKSSNNNGERGGIVSSSFKNDLIRFQITWKTSPRVKHPLSIILIVSLFFFFFYLWQRKTLNDPLKIHIVSKQGRLLDPALGEDADY